ncbi:hypothetical protein Esti_004776 [Eimeria stiedai]
METALLACRCIDTKPPCSVEALRFSPDGRWLAVGRSSGVVEVFSSTSRHLKLRLVDSSCTSVRNIVWFPLTVAAVEAVSASEGGRLSEENEMNNSNAISLFGWRLVTAGLHGMVTSWNLRTCRVEVESPSYGGAVFSLCRAPADVCSPAFAAACDDGRVRLFQLGGLAEEVCREARGSAAADPLVAEGAADEVRVITTLPKTKTRLLSVCWYSADLVFAGNAAACISRFSRGGPHQAFVADGKMMLETQPAAGSSSESNATLVWNLRALRRRSLLVSGDSRGRVTLWSLPACVALRSLQVHVADVLDLEIMVCIDSFIGAHADAETPIVQMQQEVIFSVGVDGKIAAINRTEEDRWVVGACRFPHLCDTQAIACLPRIPGGPDASLVVTGAADGSIKYMQQLTELAGLKAPCLSFCLSPAMQGLQRPRILWKKRLFLCSSEEDVGIWHIEDSALQDSAASTSHDNTSPPLLRLARLSLQPGVKIKCCDLNRDGHLVAVGSDAGLRLFAVHLKEVKDLSSLNIQDVECIGSCSISEAVTAVQFVSRSVVACCHYSKKQRRSANFRKLLHEGDESAGTKAGEERRTKRRTESQGSRDASGVRSQRWVYSELPSLRETEALPEPLLKEGGTFCLSFIKVSTGQEMASARGLPFPIVLMKLSADMTKLGCLNSNGSIFVVNTKAFEATHFFPNVFKGGESVASFCFSPDATRMFVLGTRNGYFTASLDTNESESALRGESNELTEGDKADNTSARRRQKRNIQQRIRSIPTRQLSRGDGCILDAEWLEPSSSESCVLCLTPSSLYKIPISKYDEKAERPNKFRKTRRTDIRLLNVSSASEDERAESPEAPSPHAGFFPRGFKKLPSRRPVMIGPSPVHAAGFCVPRLLPPSLFANHQEPSSSAWSVSASCHSPSRTASTRSTATTPADSPVSDGRGEESAGNNGVKGKSQDAFGALRHSEGKGFIGFAFESCKKPPNRAEASNAPPTPPAGHVLILLEALSTRESATPPLPHFSRKRYGT